MSKVILPSPADTAREIVILGQGMLAGNYVFVALRITVYEVIVGFAAGGQSSASPWARSWARPGSGRRP